MIVPSHSRTLRMIAPPSMEVLAGQFCERIPVTEVTFATLPRKVQRFYLRRLMGQMAPLTELAARCLANDARRVESARKGERKRVPVVLRKRRTGAGRPVLRYEVRMAAAGRGMVAVTSSAVRVQAPALEATA